MSCIVALYYSLASLSKRFRSARWLCCLRRVMISLYARSWCESLRDLKGTTRMALKSQYYKIMRYWLPLREQMANLPGSSVYSLLMCYMFMWSYWEGLLGGTTVGVMVVWLLYNLGFVDLTPCLYWTIFPMMVSSKDGQYRAALVYVSPGQEE